MSIDHFSRIFSIIFLRSRLRDFEQATEKAEVEYRALKTTAELTVGEGLPSPESIEQESSVFEQFLELNALNREELWEQLRENQTRARKQLEEVRDTWNKRDENSPQPMQESIRSLNDRMKRRISSFMSMLIFVGGMGIGMSVITGAEDVDPTRLSKEEADILRLTPQNFVETGGLMAKLPGPGKTLEVQGMPDGVWTLVRFGESTDELHTLDEMRKDVALLWENVSLGYQDVLKTIEDMPDSSGDNKEEVNKYLAEYGKGHDVKDLEMVFLTYKIGMDRRFAKYEDDLESFAGLESAAYEVWRQQETSEQVSVEAAERLKGELKDIGIVVVVTPPGYRGT